MLYRLRFFASARRYIRALPDNLRRDVSAAILDLQEDPRPPAHKSLTRELQGRYRIAVNGLRIIYMVNDDDKVVTIVAVRPRGAETYLNL